MNKFAVLLTVGVTVIGAAVCRADNKTTFRDSMGRNMGSATTDRYGKTTYRDAQGRIKGTRK